MKTKETLDGELRRGGGVIDKPQIVQTTAQATAVIRLVVPRAEIRNVMGPGYRELVAEVRRQGVAITGPWHTHHFKLPGDTFDFAIGVPVAAPVAAVGRVQAGELRATTVARATYRGGYEGLESAWGELQSWIVAEGLATAADLWEVYAVGPESGGDTTNWETELNRPLVR